MPFAFSNVIPVSWRHLVPLTFVTSLIGSIVLSFFLPVILWLFLLIVVSYVLINLYFSINIAKEKGLRYLFYTPIIFASLHFTYGLGSIWGSLKLIISKLF